MGRHRPERGFTLIELIIVIAVIAVLSTGVFIGLGAMSAGNLRSSATTVVAAVRYAYSRAVTQGSTTRVVLDFEKRTVHIEETDERVVLAREDGTSEGFILREDEDEEELEELKEKDSDSASMGMNQMGLGNTPLGQMGGMGMGMGGMGMGMGGMGMGTGSDGNSMGNMFGDMMGNMFSNNAPLSDPFLNAMQFGVTGGPVGYRRPKFKKLEGRKGEARELKGSSIFLQVYSPHDNEPREEGKAYIYFFPGGVTEHVIVQLSDGDELVYSVETHPLRGQATIHSFALEPEEHLDDLQEADE